MLASDQNKISRVCKESPRAAENHTDQRQYRLTLYHSHATTCKTNHNPTSPKCGSGGVYAAMASSIRFGPEGAQGVFAPRRIVPFLVCHPNIIFVPSFFNYAGN